MIHIEKNKINTLKYTEYIKIIMAHKTITISDDAYNSLNKMKKENESFTDVILRITKDEKNKDNLLSWIKNKKSNPNLAELISDVFNDRDTIELRSF